MFSLSGIKALEWRDYVVVSTNGSIYLSDIEADGENADVGSSGAINIGSYGLFSDVSVDNVHIHNITAEDGYIHVLNIWNQTGSMEIDVSNVTINDITNTVGGINTMALGVGVMTGAGEGDFTGSVRNTTISNIYANEAAIAIGALASGGVGDAHVDIDVTNTTINNINFNPLFGQINFAALFSTTAEGVGMESVSNISAQNIIVSDVDQAGQSSNCLIADNGTLFGLDGVGTPSITSLGGNLSDDSSCNDYFTHPTDQTELSGLADTLGLLSDNGGLVPTIPLLPGSPAIDAGVPVAGLLSDARGISRPQCSAYDSGAYEYNGTCPTPSTDPLTTPVSNNTTSYLVLPEGISNPVFSTTPDNQITPDPAFNYPAGLVSFQFDTTPGSTETITLYFDLPGEPTDYIARKYNTTTNAYTTIDQATITRETYNNKDLLKLTYPITDGGLLDQDNTVNGTIVDPVGLASQTTGSANTGLQQHWLLGVKRQGDTIKVTLKHKQDDRYIQNEK
jgi:hypothetical protein